VPWVRRTPYFVVGCRDSADGAAPLASYSLLSAEAADLTTDEFDALLGIPEDRWVWRRDEVAIALCRRGLLVSDDPDDSLVQLRQRDESLTRLGWDSAAAFFHLTSRWSDVEADVDDDVPEGSPPPTFHERVAERRTPLPPVERRSELRRILRARATARSFDPFAAMSLQELSVLLDEVWGAHGFLEVTEDVSLVRKTSPSGGSLHPIEVYPLLVRVDGVEPGLYHYCVARHELELIEPLEVSQARELLVTFTAGQPYFRSAAALFLMTARFGRTFWKYREHPKAYRVVLLDAGHLSQTFYLVCTELGLAPFVTAAVNEANIEERLGLDPLDEGALVACGCGRAGPSSSDRAPDFEPYAPGG